MDESPIGGLRPDERILEGAWVAIDRQVVRDPVSVRIAQLIANELIEVGTADGGWSTLYLDPADGRYWEHTYPHSEMHGGGPASLTQVDIDAARKKYGIP